MTSQTDQFLMYVGTDTTGASEGIYVYRFDAATGSMEHLSTTPGVENPAFLAIDPGGRYLYSVAATDAESNVETGSVHAFAIDQTTGELSALNHQSSKGAGTCHITVDHTGRYVLAANYWSGSVAMLPIQGNGSLGEAVSVVQHEGSGPDPERQEGPHAHSITVDPSNRYAFAADLGLDKMMVYKLDTDRGSMAPNDKPWVSTAPGAGPRHFDFHPNRRHAYVINELDSTLTAFRYNESIGTLSEVQSISTIPEDFTDINYCADVHVHPSGKFVYGSNRGHDSIVMCAVDKATGALTYLGCELTQGETPRNFAIDPTGAYLLAANQDSDSIVTFLIDQETGMLEPTGTAVDVPTPVCLKLIPAR